MTTEIGGLKLGMHHDRTPTQTSGIYARNRVPYLPSRVSYFLRSSRHCHFQALCDVKMVTTVHASAGRRYEGAPRDASPNWMLRPAAEGMAMAITPLVHA